MNIKTPPCYDISHWKEVPDFKLVNPRPLLFITKATEGISLVDEKFIRFAKGFIEIGCVRGFYHFNRKAYGGVKQAQHFLNTISKIEILSTDILILDIEEGGEKASELWAWHDTVSKAYSNIRMNYSRKNILDPIPMSYAEKDYFRKIWTWPAGYPTFPDLYSTVPRSYVPDQMKYGPVGLWQYSSHGAITGIIGDVDLNLIEPVFQALIGELQMGNFIPKNFSATAKQNANVWNIIGGQQVAVIPSGTTVTGDGEQEVNSVWYLHVTNPTSKTGWTKKQWFNVTYPPTPEPEPEPEPTDEYILHVKDNVTRKFIPE